MDTVNQSVQRAIASVNGSSTWNDLCLKYVANMYGLSASGTPDPKTAYNAWLTNPNQHPGDENAPAGALVYWQGRLGSAGHVAISIGNGEVVSTHANNGQPGIYNISDIHIGKYLGWTDPSFGADNWTVPKDFTPNSAPSYVIGSQSTPSTYSRVGPGQTKAEQAATSQQNSSNFVTDFLTNPIGAIQGLLSATNPLNAFEAMASRFLWITLPSSWIRIQAAIGGIILLILAIILFAWEGTSSG